MLYLDEGLFAIITDVTDAIWLQKVTLYLLCLNPSPTSSFRFGCSDEARGAKNLSGVGSMTWPRGGWGEALLGVGKRSWLRISDSNHHLNILSRCLTEIWSYIH